MEKAFSNCVIPTVTLAVREINTLVVLKNISVFFWAVFTTSIVFGRSAGRFDLFWVWWRWNLIQSCMTRIRLYFHYYQNTLGKRMLVIYPGHTVFYTGMIWRVKKLDITVNMQSVCMIIFSGNFRLNNIISIALHPSCLFILLSIAQQMTSLECKSITTARYNHSSCVLSRVRSEAYSDYLFASPLQTIRAPFSAYGSPLSCS